MAVKIYTKEQKYLLLAISENIKKQRAAKNGDNVDFVCRIDFSSLHTNYTAISIIDAARQLFSKQINSEKTMFRIISSISETDDSIILNIPAQTVQYITDLRESRLYLTDTQFIIYFCLSGYCQKIFDIFTVNDKSVTLSITDLRAKLGFKGLEYRQFGEFKRLLSRISEDFTEETGITLNISFKKIGNKTYNTVIMQFSNSIAESIALSPAYIDTCNYLNSIFSDIERAQTVTDLLLKKGYLHKASARFSELQDQIVAGYKTKKDISTLTNFILENDFAIIR